MFALGEQSCYHGRLAPGPSVPSTWGAKMSRRVSRCVAPRGVRWLTAAAAGAAAAAVFAVPKAGAQAPATTPTTAPRAGARSGAASCRIEGVWELTSVSVNGKDQPLQGRRERKFVDRGNFMWISETPRSNVVRVRSTDSTRTNPITAGAGTYTVAGNTYTEHLEYFFDPRRERQSLPAGCRTEGDRWYHTYSWPDDPATASGQRPQTTEVWRRVR